MFSFISRTHLVSSVSTFAVAALCTSTAFAQASADAQVGAAACHSAMASTQEWKSLSRDLNKLGLRLAPECDAPAGEMNVRLVVVDSERASRVLRGPLADGEAVETGAAGVQTERTADSNADAWSPDVHFNRRWLQKTMESHQFLATAQGSWRVSEPRSAGIKVAAR